MKQLLPAIAFMLCLLKTDPMLAQAEQTTLNGISAKVLFIDYNTPNGINGFKISNGLELTYLRSLTQNFGIGFPIKIGLANLDGSSDKTTLVSVDLVGRYLFAAPENRFRPYLFAGAGLVFEEFTDQNVQIPLGLGMYYRVGETSFLTLQGEYRKALEDQRDNLQLGLGWHFALKPVPRKEPIDSDADGLPDEQDHCPTEAGILLANGCPDTDEDSVANGEDDCPTQKGPAALNGCPDSDSDGIPDLSDQCPNQAGSQENGGCPAQKANDRDGDGVADAADQCPDVPGLVTLAGCPKQKAPESPANLDSDGDGTTDARDECPDVSGKMALSGCPDGDSDGIADKDDRCPEEAGLPARNGCPPKDSDADGILDENDDCPNLAGPAATAGCPDNDKDGVTDNKDECPGQPGNLRGCPDKDSDGVADNKDECPNEKGSAASNGCPIKDADGDGIPDEKDECPNERGIAAFQGCADSDGDGIPDKNDRCPNEKGGADRNGCPPKDSDLDGILDELDLCPNEAGSATANGCPDSDGDGIADRDDKCPRTFGKFQGCPDTDGDGIDDGSDFCPSLPGVASAKGCPDSDADGFADRDDKCPDEAGKNQGCPEIKPEDKEFLNLAAKNVQFETGKATLKAQSFGTLNKVAEILEKYPRYNLFIGGHTDNQGNDAANQLLSEERAKSCYEYLLSRQVSPLRMQYKGYGKSQPLMDNGTEKGREANRRVEFTLMLK